MREIAHEADMVSTHGWDDQQIQFVTRIRCLAHEGLKDHGGSSTMAVDNSENEVGKKRGKERVRRRGNPKRRRKDDPGEYYPPAMTRLYSSVIVTDEAQLYHVPNEVDQEHLCIPSNDVNESEYQPGVEEVDEDQISHGSEENLPCEPLATVTVVEQSSLGTSEDVAHQNDFTVTV